MKIALVTGGSRGVGKNAAIELAKRGLGVVITYKSKADDAQSVVAAITQSGGKAAAIKLEAGDVKSFDAFAAELSHTLRTVFGRDTFDALVNNAGIAQRTMIKDLTEAQFDELTNVHLKGVYFLTQKLLPMIADGGQIVFISSGLARRAYPGGVAVYAALKSAIETLTRYVAVEFAGRKIRANCVAPGALDTDFGGGRTDAMRKMIGEHTLLGRIGTAEDIGPIIASVVSNEFGWVNGQTIEANGGLAI